MSLRVLRKFVTPFIAHWQQIISNYLCRYIDKINIYLILLKETNKSEN